MGWYRLDLLGSRLAFTDRRGGRSRAPFDSLNLSTEQGDDAGDVATNRELAGAFVGVPARDWVPIRQVHGTGVAVCDSPGAVTDPVDADAVVVTVPRRAGFVLTADCVPLALVSPTGVGAVHGGWRGLLAGVVSEAVAALTDASEPPTVAVLGPCIRPCCYEFGDDDLATMADRFGDGVRARTDAGRPALDMPAVVRANLTGSGVEHLAEIPVCTACSRDSFSHRRDGGVSGSTGRQGLLVARLP